MVKKFNCIYCSIDFKLSAKTDDDLDIVFCPVCGRDVEVEEPSE